MRVFRSEKYCPDVVDYIRKMLDIGVDHITVVTGPLDQRNTYAEILESFSKEEVSALYVEGYATPNCWSLALNAGIKFLWDNKDDFKIGDGDQLLVFSNEVSLTKEMLDAMKNAMVSNVGVVGVRFPGFTAESYQFPRNTLALWNLPMLFHYKGFSLECDNLGGMEDYALLLKIIKKGWKYVMLDMPLGVSLGIAPVTNQSEKQKTESDAMEKIRNKSGK